MPGIWPIVKSEVTLPDEGTAKTVAPEKLDAPVIWPADSGGSVPSPVRAKLAAAAKLAADGHGGPVHIHATTVALNGCAVLIIGASGSGKSGLGLLLMAYGCTLIADDQTIVTRRDNSLIASCPPTIRGQIEARGVGILTATPVADATLVLVIDMDRTEEQRLPPPRTYPLMGLTLPLLHKADIRSFAAAILQYLRQEQSDPGPTTP